MTNVLTYLDLRDDLVLTSPLVMYRPAGPDAEWRTVPTDRVDAWDAHGYLGTVTLAPTS